MNKIKVAHLIWSLEIGGVEKGIQTLVSHLNPGRFDSLVICLNQKGRLAESMEQKGIRVLALRKDPGIDLWMLFRLTALLKKEKVQILHARLFGANFWGRLAAKMAGVPIVIAQEHGMQPWRSPLHFTLDRWLAGITNRILFVSESVMKIYCERTGLSSGKMTLVKNGVRLPDIPNDKPACREKIGCPKDSRVILSVGRLSPEKGHEDLIKAFSGLSQKFPNVRLVLVGDGANKNHLMQIAKAEGLNGRILFAGGQDDVTPFFLGADLYVQPSQREGLSFAILEAMAAALPVIATRVGDADKVIRDSVDGYLIPPNDVALMNRKISWLLEHLEEQAPLRRAARKVVETTYSNTMMIDSIEKVYEEELAALQKRRSEIR